MEQYDTALESTNTALNSSGSGYRENAEYLKSYEAQINMVKNAWTEAIIAMRDAGLGDAIVIALSAGVELFKMLTSIIDTLGVLPTLVAGAGIVLLLLSERFRTLNTSMASSGARAFKWSGDVVKSVKSSELSVAQWAKSVARNMGLAEASANKASVAIKKASVQPTVAPTKGVGVPAPLPTQATGELGKLPNLADNATKGIKGITGAVGALGRSLFSLAGPIGVMMALGSGISWVAGKYMEKKRAHDDMMKSAKEMQEADREAVTTNKEQTNEMIRSYKDLHAEREKNQGTARWSLEQEKEYLSVSKQLGDTFPSLVEKIGKKGEVHLKNVDAIDEEIEKVKELARLEDLQAIKGEENAYKETLRESDDLQKRLEQAEANLRTAENTAENSAFGWSRDRAKDAIPDLKTDIAYFDSLLPKFNDSLSQQVNEVSQKYLEINDVIEGIATESENIYRAIDFSGMDSAEISQARKVLDGFAISRSMAFEKGDVESFNSATRGLSEQLQQNYGLERAEVNDLISHYLTFEESIDKATRSENNLSEAMKQLADETDMTEEELSQFVDGVEDLDEALKESTASVKNINGVLEEYHENGSITTEKMLELIDTYPELINYIDDEGRFIEALTEIRDNDVSNAETAMSNKLMLSNDFYQKNLDLIKEFVEGQFDYYEGDLENFQNLAQAKADVETQLIERLSKKWSVYYNQVQKQFQSFDASSPIAMMNEMNPLRKSMLNATSGLSSSETALKEGQKMLDIFKANRALANFENTWENFTMDKINLDFKTLGTKLDNSGKKIGKESKAKKGNEKATKKAEKAQKDYEKSMKESLKTYEDSIYVADSYKSALEMIELALAKVNSEKKQYANWSKQYRRELEKEIKILKEKEKAIQQERKSVEQQIKSGAVQKTGVVSTGDVNVSSGGGGSYTGKYANEINKASRTYGIDPNLIAAVIQAESSFNNNVRSHAGAQGLMQLMPGTAKYLGVKDVWNPEQNIMGGTKYLAEQLKAFGGDINKALAAYNAGPGNVRKYGGIPPFKETQNYVKKITSSLGQISTATSKASTGMQNMSKYYLDNFRISSKFGKRNTGIPGASTNHKGTDFAAPSGTSIKSLRDGKVIASYYHNAQGHVVQVMQDDGVVAHYQHMQRKSPVGIGSTVKAGQEIGKVGATGVASGAHLHLEIKRDGTHIDPETYLKQVSSVATKEIAEVHQDVDGLRSNALQLQQESIRVQDEIQELYMQIVESHLASIDRVKNRYAKDLAKIDLIQNREGETTKKWINQQFKKENILRKQQAQEQKAIDFINKQIKSNNNLSKAQKALLDDQLIERYQALYSLENDLLEQRLSMVEQVTDVYKRALEAQKDSALKAIDDMLDDIDKKEKEAEYKRRLNKEQSSRQEILDEISQWALDDSDMAKKRVKELTEQLQEIDEAIDDMQHQKGLDDRRESLNDEKERVGQKYDDLINDEKKYLDMRTALIKGNTKAIKKDLDSFSKDIKKMSKDLGKSFVNNLVRAINQAGNYLGNSKLKSVEIPHFNTGGLARVKDPDGGLAVVHDKEHIFKPDDTENLLKTVKLSGELASKMQKVFIPEMPEIPNLAGVGGDNVYNINLNIEKMNGDENDVNKFMDKIVSNVRRRGGRM